MVETVRMCHSKTVLSDKIKKQNILDDECYDTDSMFYQLSVNHWHYGASELLNDCFLS